MSCQITRSSFSKKTKTKKNKKQKNTKRRLSILRLPPHGESWATAKYIEYFSGKET